MVEIIGTLKGTEQEDSVIRDQWRIPALSSNTARIQARANSRFKGRNSPEIEEISTIGSGDIPGQNIYEVIVVSER